MLGRALHHLDLALRFAAALVLCLLLLSVTLGVVTRAAGDPLIWTDEVSRFLMIWLAVLGWLLASRQRVHIRIRYFIGKLPAALRRKLELVLQLAVALFGGLTLWFSYDLVSRNLDVTATTVPIAMSFMYLPIALAGLVTALQALAEAWELAHAPPQAGSAAP